MRLRVFALIAFLVLISAPAIAQQSSPGGSIQGKDISTGAAVNTGDATNKSFRVTCISPTTHNPESCAGTGGGGGGGSDAQGDNTSLLNVLPMGALFTTSPPTIASGNVGLPRMDATRYLFTVFPSAQSVNASQAGSWSVGQTGVWTTRLFDGSGNSITSTSNALDVNVKNASLAVTGTFWQATQPVSLATLPALTAGSAVIGHVIVDSGSTTAVTGNVTATQATGSNLHVVVDTAPTTAVTGPLTDTQLRASAPAVALSQTGPNNDVDVLTLPALPAGTNVIGHVIHDAGSTTAVTGVVHVDDNAGSLTVDGTVTTTPPANASTNVTQVAGTAVDVNSGVKSAGTQRFVLATDQPQLTNALKVDGTATIQPISATSLPLPTLAATSTKQSDGTQKTQVVDGSGNVISAVANALNVSTSTAQITGSTTFTTSGQTLVIPTNNSGVMSFQVSGLFTGGIFVEGSVDGVTWTGANLPLWDAGTSVSATSIGAAGRVYIANAAPFTSLRLETVSFTGTSTVSWIIKPGLGTDFGTIRTIGSVPAPTGVYNSVQPTAPFSSSPIAVQSTIRGAQIVATGVDAFNITVNTALPAGTNVIGHVISDASSAVIGHVVADSGSTTAVTGVVHVDDNAGSLTVDGTITANAGTGTFTEQGAAASGAAKSGNPMQIGGVFNTTQPTVTTGQAVEAQSTARGAQVVATGVDTFNVTVNAALPAGAAILGKVGIDQTTPGTTNGVQVNAALPAGTNVIGHIINDASSAVIGHVIDDSGSTTAVTGNVTVVQGTGSNLHIACDSGCGGAATFADNAAFTFGTTSIGNTGYVVDDVATNAVAENSSGSPRMTTARVPYADLSKSASNTNSFKVDFGGSAQPISLATLPALVAGSAVIGHVIADTGSTTAITGTVTTAPPANASTNLAQVAGTATDTNSGVKSAGTIRVVLATDQPALTNKLLVTPDSVALPANQSVNISQINAVTPLMGNGVTGTGSQRVTIASDNTAFAVNATPPAIAKATQGSIGYTTQDLKDAGRTLVTLTAERVIPILTTDTIVTFSKLVGDTVTATQTTYAVTSGKTLRLQYMTISLTPSSTTLGVIQVRLRTLSSGACTVAAGVKVAGWELGNPGTATQVANASNQREDIVFPDGMEFSGATRNICISMNALAAAAQTVTISLVGYEY